MTKSRPIILERRYRARLADLWALWTTPEGIEAWWGPPGFSVTVDEMDLRPGGLLRYTMTATAPAMVAFIEKNGMAVSTPARARFEAVEPMTRIAWRQFVDFIPGHAPYETALSVEFDEAGDEVTMRLTVEPLHDGEWTARQSAGWQQELDKLARLLADRGLGTALPTA